MSLPRFEYLQPKTVKEACSLLSRHKGIVKVIAGGTDLLPKMKARQVVPQFVLGLKGIAGLDYIKHDKAHGLRIGALATLKSLQTSSLVRSKFGALAQAIDHMASPQVRSLGTLGGNLCNASPSADTACPLIVMGATLKLAGPKGARMVLVEEFFLGPEKTVLGDGELLVEICVPDPPAHSAAVYLKHTVRRAMDLALVGVAATMSLNTAGSVRDVKVALGAVAPTPLRAQKAEDMLKGQKFSGELVSQAAQAAAKEARPISDVRSPADYRREMVRVLTQRAITEVWEKAKSV
jgi:aerobic carbon-monoxide dehydrogenase medium subunit